MPATSLVDLIEAQVRAGAGAVAVVAGDRSLTYEELDGRANRLAHHLQALGVGPETVVGVCVERSLEMVVAFLGVLKAGGACMPLDPSYPMERLALMLADSQTAASRERYRSSPLWLSSGSSGGAWCLRRRPSRARPGGRSLDAGSGVAWPKSRCLGV
jgi:non-ribosomal peptide synthetase component F